MEKNRILISVRSEQEFEKRFRILSDLISIAWVFKPYIFSVNGKEICDRTQIKYFADYFAESHSIKFYGFSSIEDLRWKYITSRKKKKKQEEIVNKAKITREDPIRSLANVIEKYCELYGHNKSIQKYEVSQYESVLVIEDSVIVDFCIYPIPLRRKDDPYFKEREWEYPEIIIQELCHNEIYKFNFARFGRHIESSGISLESCIFHGLDYYEKEIDRFDFVDKTLPQLQLRKRYVEYPGETHHLILLRMVDSTGSFKYGFAETKRTVHSFIQKLCDELQENKKIKWENSYAFSCLDVYVNGEFLDAFVSWKGSSVPSH